MRVSAITGEETLRAIRATYERWLNGQLADEDALFEIGDILSAAGTEGDVPELSTRAES